MVYIHRSITLTLFVFVTCNMGAPNPHSYVGSLLPYPFHTSNNRTDRDSKFVDNLGTSAELSDENRGRIIDHFDLQQSSSCPKCKVDLNHEEVDEEEINEKVMRSIRLELIKIQILAKLNLTEAPKEDRRRKHIPSLIQEGRVPGASLDYFPTAPEAVSPPSIFVADSRIPCPNDIKSPSSCFKFDFIGEINAREPTALDAVLWFFKLPDKSDGAPQMITVSQLQLWQNRDNGKSGPELLISHLITNVTEGWISINISWPYGSPATSTTTLAPLHVRISCTTCTGFRHRHPVSGSNNHRPFLVMKSLSTTQEEKVRTKRSTRECTSSNEGCCRSSIYVNFAELGWSDWIYQPKGFTMYYCRGSCRNVTTDSVNSAGHTYTGMLRRLLLRPNLPSSLKDDLAPCCSPGHKEPLSLLCRTGLSSSAISVRILQDMIVESCSCYD